MSLKGAKVRRTGEGPFGNEFDHAEMAQLAGRSAFSGINPTRVVFRERLNFTEYAVLGDYADNDPRTVGKSSQLFARSSCILQSSGATFDNTYAGDNIAGPGTTSTSRTLQ